MLKKSATDYDVKWGNASGQFRGEWATDTLVYTQNFSGGSIPAPFTVGHDNLAVNAYLQSVTAPAGTSLTSAVRCENTDIRTIDASWLELNLASLGITGITRVAFWAEGSGDTNATWHAADVLKNGVSVWSSVDAFAWKYQSVTASSTDVLRFRGRGNQGSTVGNVHGRADFTGIEVYASSDPYMTGQFVTYQGKLWKSQSDNNGGTPGTTGWTEVPLYAPGAPVATKTANYTATATDSVIVANGATVTITLLDPTTCPGRTFWVKNINAASATVNSAGTSKTIDGAASVTLAQWARGQYVSDGTQWLVVGS